MAKGFIHGLKSVEFGDIATDGGVATVFAAQGLTFKDTFEIIEADADVKEFFAEETDEAVLAVSTKGKMQMKFELMNYDNTSLAYLKGGSIVSDVYNADRFTVNIEKSVKVTPTTGMIFTFPRCLITTKWKGKLSKGELMTLEVTITVMTPTKAGVAPYTLTEQA